MRLSDMKIGTRLGLGFGLLLVLMLAIVGMSSNTLKVIGSVNHHLIDVDEATQQNAMLVEEAAAASSALQDQTTELVRGVGIFKINAPQTIDVTATVEFTPVNPSRPPREASPNQEGKLRLA